MASSYHVRFYHSETGNEPVRDWLQELPALHRREIGGVIWKLQMYGVYLGMPHSRPIGRGLYELRIPCEGLAYRVFYGFAKGQLLLLLHGVVKKDQKTPVQDLQLARTRLMEMIAYLKEEGGS